MSLLTIGEMELAIIILLRILGFFATAPFFSGKYINNYVKAGLALMIAIFIILTNETISVPYSFFDNTLGYAGVCIVELLIGVIIGFCATIIFNVVIFAGSLIDSQAGLTMATVYDPSSSTQLAITANLYYYALIMVFLATNMHHSFIKAIFYSYELLPVGVFNVTGPTISYMISIMTEFFLLGFKFASPVIAAMLILDVGLGILVRAVPQMNMFVVGFPLKLAIFMLVMFLATELFIQNYAYIYDKTITVIINTIRLFGVSP